MYIPKHFVIAETAACHRVIVGNGFGELVTLDDAGLPFASHLPFLIDPARGASGMRAIVAFEIPVDRLEGKAKLSQNRDATDQARVAEALAASGDPLAQATSRVMRN